MVLSGRLRTCAQEGGGAGSRSSKMNENRKEEEGIKTDVNRNFDLRNPRARVSSSFSPGITSASRLSSNG